MRSRESGANLGWQLLNWNRTFLTELGFVGHLPTLPLSPFYGVLCGTLAPLCSDSLNCFSSFSPQLETEFQSLKGPPFSKNLQKKTFKLTPSHEHL